MADITGGAVPGMDVKSILKQMQGAPEAFAAEVKPYQDQLAASTTKIEEMQKKQAAERAPIVGQIKAKSAEPGPEYKPGELPDFKPPQIDPKEMNDTMSLLTAVAAMSGLLTRQPLTAALNAFSQGVHGYVQGNQEVYKRSLDTFKTSFEKAKTTNDEHYRQVQQAQAKHKNDIQGLMNELSVLSAEHQDAVQSEMLRRGDLTSAINLVEKRHQSMDKMMTNVARIAETQQQHKETARHNAAMEGIAGRRVDVAETNAETKGGKDSFKREKDLRTEHDKVAKPISDYERTISKVRAAIATGEPLGDIQARQLVSELSKGARGTNMQLKITNNFGDLGSRLAGLYTNFAQGRMTDDQRRQFGAFLDALETTVVAPEKTALRDRYTYLAKEAGVKPENVVYGETGAPAAPAAASAMGEKFNPDAFLDQFTKGKPQ